MNDDQPHSGRLSQFGGATNIQLTADRFELKYLLPGEQAQVFLRDVIHNLPPHAPARGGVAEPVPRDLEQHITTTYLDTPGGDIFRACLAGGSDEKLRIKEYRSVGAPAAAPVVVWLEIKRSSGPRTRKDRMAVPRDVIDDALAAGSISVDALVAATDRSDEESHELLQRLWRIQQRYRQPLMPSCVVRYSRNAWQDERGLLRVTVDRGLRACRPWAAEAGSIPLLPESASGESMILEVKYCEQLPEWLAAHLTRLAPACLPHTLERSFSKFLAGGLGVQGLEETDQRSRAQLELAPE